MGRGKGMRETTLWMQATTRDKVEPTEDVTGNEGEGMEEQQRAGVIRDHVTVEASRV